MKNATLSVDEGVLAVVRRYAAERDSSVNRLVREFLGGGARGWLADSLDVDAVGRALSEAIQAGQGEREERAAQARAWVLDHHAMDRMIDDLEAVYEELL